MMFPLARPALFALDAERAHAMTIAMLAAWGKAGTPLAPRKADPVLHTRLAGLDFANPIGLAAGVDKDAEAIAGFLGLGFGSVEVGTLTLRPQEGNPKPRLFRLVEDRAVINRMGFNNRGLNAALARVSAFRDTKAGGVVGINVGANKDSTDRAADYAAGVALAQGLADYVTINVSSPNTPGLRDLQHGEALAELLAAARAGTTKPLFLKVAPDLDATAIDGVARAAIDHRIDALIVGNTTLSRDGLTSPHKGEAGGMSGAPLADLARTKLADFRRATGGQMPLIAAGGIGSAAEAYARIRIGATLVQVYSAMVYEGPGLPARLSRELAALLRRDGFATAAEAVGTDVR